MMTLTCGMSVIYRDKDLSALIEFGSLAESMSKSCRVNSLSFAQKSSCQEENMCGRAIRESNFPVIPIVKLPVIDQQRAPNRSAQRPTSGLVGRTELQDPYCKEPGQAHLQY